MESEKSEYVSSNGGNDLEGDEQKAFIYCRESVVIRQRKEPFLMMLNVK
ncbi:37018_t:CDS:2 [Racocetra persica]|uniref:37018_t:CDS:1 n=1 Tax=Racocetra persica TaxID=160502 RepID=A0ACA9MDQ7_9GLOM|nr:37018_t:CDS:2 [Racocetra persica]